MKFIAIYVRVSSKQQDQRSQEPDLKRWVAAQESEVAWYRDKFTGRTMQRPGMKTLLADSKLARLTRLSCGGWIVWAEPPKG